MNMVIPDEGKLLLAEWMLVTEASSFGDMEVVMYTNNYTPVDGSTSTDFTPATFTGGDPILITRAEWDAPTLVSHVAYVALPSPPTWTCTGAGPETCYGWVLYDVSTSTVIAAQRFDTARVMDTGAVEALDPFRIGLQTLH